MFGSFIDTSILRYTQCVSWYEYSARVALSICVYLFVEIVTSLPIYTVGTVGTAVETEGCNRKGRGCWLE